MNLQKMAEKDAAGFFKLDRRVSERIAQSPEYKQLLSDAYTKLESGLTKPSQSKKKTFIVGAIIGYALVRTGADEIIIDETYHLYKSAKRRFTR